MPNETKTLTYESKTKLAKTNEGSPSLDIFFTPRGSVPVCNQSCSGCYYFANYNSKEKAISASEVPDLIKHFKELGFEVFFPITSEILLADNWKDYFKMTGDTYVNTNGKVIASKGKSLLEELADAGIKQIIMTGNVTNSHDALNLTSKPIVEKAFSNIFKYNSSNPEKHFKTGATMTITSENFNLVQYMCEYAHDVYKTDAVKFVAYIPLNGNLAGLAPSLEQLAVSLAQIDEMRQHYDPSTFYIQRGGTMGSQGLSEEKISGLCPAGESLYAVKSMENGSPVTPCIYIPHIAVGHVSDGAIVIDKKALDEFNQFKLKTINEGYCPAHAITTGKVF